MFVSVNKENVVFSVDEKSITDQTLHSENAGGNSPHSSKPLLDHITSQKFDYNTTVSKATQRIKIHIYKQRPLRSETLINKIVKQNQSDS